MGAVQVLHRLPSAEAASSVVVPGKDPSDAPVEEVPSAAVSVEDPSDAPAVEVPSAAVHGMDALAEGFLGSEASAVERPFPTTGVEPCPVVVPTPHRQMEILHPDSEC